MQTPLQRLRNQLPMVCLFLFITSLTRLEAIDLLPVEERRNGKETLGAFGDASKAGFRSTVRLVSKGRTLALGTIVTSKGHVITKASSSIGVQEATLADGTSYKIRTIGIDKETDLALLKMKRAKDLSPVTWAEGNDPGEGSWLVSADPTLKRLKVGVIGAKSRPIDRIGGVIGVILGRDGEEMGGVMIQRIMPRSAGAAAGLKNGDIITSVEGQKVTAREKVIELVGANDPGEIVDIQVKRSESMLSFRVTLGHRSVAFEMLDRNARMSGPVSKRKDNFPMVIQHDVSLPPTAMGGPVLNLDGKALGINVARVDRVTTYALPAKFVREIFKKLRRPKPKGE
jgi:serine protease Do